MSEWTWDFAHNGFSRIWPEDKAHQLEPGGVSVHGRFDYIRDLHSSPGRSSIFQWLLITILDLSALSEGRWIGTSRTMERIWTPIESCMNYVIFRYFSFSPQPIFPFSNTNQALYLHCWTQNQSKRGRNCKRSKEEDPKYINNFQLTSRPAQCEFGTDWPNGLLEIGVSWKLGREFEQIPRCHRFYICTFAGFINIWAITRDVSKWKEVWWFAKWTMVRPTFLYVYSEITGRSYRTEECSIDSHNNISMTGFCDTATVLP